MKYKTQAIEFEADVDNGIIRIPDKLKDQVGGQVKVIVLSENTVKSERNSKTFSAISINTKGFVFNRDEANAR